MCDNNIQERSVNVVTSLPFIHTGVDCLRRASRAKAAAVAAGWTPENGAKLNGNGPGGEQLRMGKKMRNYGWA